MAKKETYFAKHKKKLASESCGILSFSKMYEATAEQRQAFADGAVLLIDKPLHWTSFDVVRKIRNSIGIKKVGHAGTLDPLATGLLIVCTGKFTKKINEFMSQQKAYTCCITLGATTPTYDLESEPENFCSIENITEEIVNTVSKKFIGSIEQYPPIYSAIKKDGEALYKLARRGEDVELQPRQINIYELTITEICLPNIKCKIVCSTGTYIRSIAHDIGQSLGCGAYLSSLRRNSIGDFDVDNADTMSDFLSKLPEKSM